MATTTSLKPESNRYPTLYTPGHIGGSSLKNRAIVAPMTRVSASEDGVPTEQMAQYYARFAQGDFALVITEGTYPDERSSQGYGNQPGIANDTQKDAWARVVDAVHKYQTPIFMQIMHAGALVQRNRWKDDTVAPSKVQPLGEKMSMYGDEGEYAMPTALTETGIFEVVDAFVDAARRARDAGFDGVEIHGANGYLIDQFITDYSNQRTDEYGGGIGNRLRVPRMIVRSVKDAMGEGFPVGIRLSQTKVNNMQHRWAGGEDDAALIFRSLAEAGVDFIHITGAGAVDPAFSNDGPSLAELARQHGRVPVIGNGELEDPARAEALLASEHVQFVSLARGALANPDWPQKIANHHDPRAFSTDMISPVATLDAQAEWEHDTGQNNPLIRNATPSNQVKESTD
ncbi:oxidoreductase [Marinobacter fonticola]|uniref:oxidoreductase n=1 Tax=Marinobacter fonticola TaxID=2603215 RepID=UPI0011E7B99B|nr:NADH:flavin oxidoreductase [Marinobacter fonticola]